MARKVVIELSDAIYEALSAAATTSGLPLEDEAVERIHQSLPALKYLKPSDEALLRAGLLKSLPDFDRATPPEQRFMARAVSGKPVSDTIVEERR